MRKPKPKCPWCGEGRVWPKDIFCVSCGKYERELIRICAPYAAKLHRVARRA